MSGVAVAVPVSCSRQIPAQRYCRYWAPTSQSFRRTPSEILTAKMRASLDKTSLNRRLRASEVQLNTDEDLLHRDYVVRVWEGSSPTKGNNQPPGAIRVHGGRPS